jgi:hypothetical protein
LLAAALWWTPLRALFRFADPAAGPMLAALGLGAALLVALEWVERRRAVG